MKKYFITLVVAVCSMITAMVVTSCSDNNDVNNMEENLPDIEPSIDVPTIDSLLVKTNAKAYVFEGKYGKVGEKLIARLTNRQNQLDSTVKLLIVTAEKFTSLSEDESAIASAAFRNGAKLLVDLTSVKSSEVIDSLGQDSLIINDIPLPDEKEGLWGLNNNLDYLWVDVPLRDSVDTRADNRIEINDYAQGLFADEVAKWINMDQGAAKKSKMSVAVSRGESNDMKVLLEAQTDTWVTYASAERFSELRNRSTPYTIFTTIYAVHRFDDDKDYYLFDQTVTGNNSPFWIGEWTAKNYKSHFDKSAHDWKIQGFYVNDWSIDNCLLRDNGRIINLSDGLTLVKHSPATTNGSVTTSTSTSWNIGGSLGTNGPTLTGGISGTVGSSQTMADISTKNRSMENNSNNNAGWKYWIDPNRQVDKGVFSCSFRRPPMAATATFSSEQTWLYELNNASQYKALTLSTAFNLAIYRTLERNPFPCMFYGYESVPSVHMHEISLRLPNRTK